MLVVLGTEDNGHYFAGGTNYSRYLIWTPVNGLEGAM